MEDENKKEIIADLHIHSRFSRACSKNIDFENLVKWAKVKGLGLLGTGDFTHPIWIKEIEEKLKEDNGNGIYYYNYEKGSFPFMITGEVSLMYSQDGKGRRVHLLLLVPNLDVAKKINLWLDTKGRRDYDGRPIFNISCRDFVAEIEGIDDKTEVIPAHCMTPWFGIFGSQTGFNSLKEAFQDKVDRIHAVESGMSASPEMLWRIKELNEKSIVSFSDSHSFWPWRMGREASIFLGDLNYKNILNQIRENSFKATVETDPAYGKYHFDGHATCKFSSSPEESKRLNNVCPICKKPLIIGVENRVEQLATNPKGFMPRTAKPFYKILPLHELIALAKASTLSSKKTWQVYNQLIEKFGNEFNILLFADKIELAKFLSNDELLVELIIKNRIGNIRVQPGYDGQYGEALLPEKQVRLF